MNVQGIYTTRTRLYDLLDVNERTAIESDAKEARETKAPQDVNVLLYMRGSLEEPVLSFKLELPNTRSTGSIAYTKLQRINMDETQLFNQVASLLLIGSFIPPNSDIAQGAQAGAISNVGEILSGTASSQLTNIISKITGDKTLSFDLKYKQYNYSQLSTTGDLSSQNRNEISLGVRKNYFNDRLTVEVGSAYDWGRPTSSGSKAYFNPVGDFRVQYQFKEGGNLRGYIFRTSNFDAINNDNISRGGVGITWRKSFNTLTEFFRGAKYARQQVEAQEQLLQQQQQPRTNTDTTENRGTW
jgi:hypothetical protein